MLCQNKSRSFFISHNAVLKEEKQAPKHCKSLFWAAAQNIHERLQESLRPAQVLRDKLKVGEKLVAALKVELRWAENVCSPAEPERFYKFDLKALLLRRKWLLSKRLLKTPMKVRPLKLLIAYEHRVVNCCPRWGYMQGDYQGHLRCSRFLSNCSR